MNMVSRKSSRATSAARRPNRRTLAKQRTREKIIDSAKALFAEKGYDGATVRDIAAAAGISTGAVFSSFSDKHELFVEIVIGEREALYDSMGKAAVGGTVSEILRLMSYAGCKIALQDRRLLQCAMSVSWSPTLGAELRSHVDRWSIAELFANVISEAIEQGELAHSTNAALIGQILWNCFLANFCEAASSDWVPEALAERLMDQADILLDGLGGPGLGGSAKARSIKAMTGLTLTPVGP
jgi:AcrR family transcriptional regulator